MSEQSFPTLDCNQPDAAPVHNGYPALAALSPAERLNQLALFFQNPNQAASHLMQEADALLTEASILRPPLHESDSRIEHINAETWAGCIDPNPPANAR